MSQVRVRFAPSPTGPLHMGGVRTALFNYLFAKKNNGKFILRIEDTDQTRYVPGAEDYIKEALEWSGMQLDEDPWQGGEYGPYRQSDRKPMYRQYADQLIEAGHAYYAFDTAEELDEMRERLTRAKVPSPQYNATVRMSMKNSLTLSADEVKARLDAGEPYTIRVKMPRNEELRFQDIIRGWVQVNTNSLDDKVIFKSDGMPTYHLANVVDDHLMKITHVIRGEEWLPSAPLHVLLYRFFGWEDTKPQFAHLPLILRPDGNGKLSKRDGDRLGFPVFPIDWKDAVTGEMSSGYREKGYFKEAFVNMLAFLGWNPGTEKELYTMDELIQDFSLERVGKSGAKFDAAKTNWYNQQFLREQSNEVLAVALKPYLDAESLTYTDSQLPTFIELMKERASFVSEMLEGRYMFEKPSEYDEKTVSKKWKENSGAILTDLASQFGQTVDFGSENLHEVFKSHLEAKEIGMGAVLPVLRVVVTGKGAGPSIFDIMAFLGKEESVDRIKEGVQKLG
ncbi:MAG: glutamate--tRNA ligase [Salibacteraceae bacterium]|nr:glutamate--tRNA ligase [Salibacteraceae bacterium]MDP4763932.1 glutamate--tRNA ligase [Salibacteraceae bacterium]MDP4934208.1 glutamate--tRNA ligase [Salibacteraceae bacterium]